MPLHEDNYAGVRYFNRKPISTSFVTATALRRIFTSLEGRFSFNVKMADKGL